MSEERDDVPQVNYVLTEEGQALLVSNADWLSDTFTGENLATRFLERFKEEMSLLCERWADGFRLSQDERATLHFSRPVFQHLLRTAKRRTRRNSSGVWRIFYEAADTDGDGVPNVLRVFSIRHAAAQPFWEVENGNEDK